jgi:hypothetical protein
MIDGILPNEEAAEYVTNIEGWVCKTCRVFYGKGGESSARYCCEKDHACNTQGCAGRAKKPYTVCDPCRSKLDLERYLKLPEADWDGEAPLVVYHDDQYFFDVDDLADWLSEQGLKVEDAQLVIAEEDRVPHFDMSEFLCDYLCEDNQDQLESTAKIDKAVNRWIEKNVPTTWVPSKKRPTPASLKKYVREPESENKD